MVGLSSVIGLSRVVTLSSNPCTRRNLDCSRLARDQPQHSTQQRSFARTIRPQQSHELATTDLKIYSVQYVAPR
ncbi:hypothetical protein MA47_04295 [Corynebacterium auriscanis]|uniref:Uncharacterized protein n=1 Tax=Corynebacterium auriscanis TaxID=99807 RepID=A0A0A2DI25_9CORY|nr:hypothetical protein MA47_04295 [Corynebacterium auriscanis]